MALIQGRRGRTEDICNKNYGAKRHTCGDRVLVTARISGIYKG
jgi:hypothetical protein